MGYPVRSVTRIGRYVAHIVGRRGCWSIAWGCEEFGPYRTKRLATLAILAMCELYDGGWL